MSHLLSWSKEHLIEAVKKSDNFREVLKNIGLSDKGDNYKTIKKYIRLWDLDVSHFYTRQKKTCKKVYDSIIDKLKDGWRSVLLLTATGRVAESG